MQNTGRSNFTRTSCQPSQNATSIGFACSVPKPYVAVTGGIGGGGNSGMCSMGTYQPANGGAFRGYCSPLVRSAAPKPSGLESSVTRTNIATFVVSSHPNSAVRGLCTPLAENANCNAINRNQLDSHFSTQQSLSAACSSELQPNFAAPDALAYANMRTTAAYRAPNVAQFPKEYLRSSESMPSPPLPPRPTQSQNSQPHWQHQQFQRDQCDVQSLIDRFEKLNAFKNEFGIQSCVTPVGVACGDASVQSQLDWSANANPNANCIAAASANVASNCRTHASVNTGLTGKTQAHVDNEAKSWNSKQQAVAAYSVCSFDVVKPQPQAALPIQSVQYEREVSRGNTLNATAQNHVTFVSANVSRTAAPLASRTTIVSDASNMYPFANCTSGSSTTCTNTRNNVSSNAPTDWTCDYEYELRRIDCDSVSSKRRIDEEVCSVAVVGSACANGSTRDSVNAQTVRSAGQNCEALSTSRCTTASDHVGTARSSKPSTDTWQNAPKPTVCATGSAQTPVSTPGKTSGRSIAMKRSSVSVARTHYPPALFRLFMEQHVEHLFRLRQERLERRAQLEREMAQMAFDETQKAGFRRMLIHRESEYTRLRRIKLSARDFEMIKLIGVGAFGKVFLVRKCASQQHESTLGKSSGEPALSTQLYAMKKLNKAELTRKNQLGHVKAERDILAESDNEWVVKLYYSFQDARYLYFILEYVPGGDLMSLLIRMGIFPENLARFYVAELILAVESVHAMRFIHRDIKPDNILICADGHLKLTDFGLCTGFRWTHSSKFYQAHMGDTRRAGDLECDAAAPAPTDKCKPKPKLLEERARSNERAREMRVAYSLVGTPNYIAPEILLRCGYTETVDWWSIGVILYEMLVGQPPFWAESPAATQYKVINHKCSLRLPSDRLSNSALSLIRALMRDPADRLGRNGADEIKSHAFFEPLRMVAPFEQLRHLRAPWQPVITHPTDTSNFDPIDEEALRMLSDEETEDNMREGDFDCDRKLDSRSPFEEDSSYEIDSPADDRASSEMRSASCETLKVIDTDETVGVTLSSVLKVSSPTCAEHDSDSDSDSNFNSSRRDLSCATSGHTNAFSEAAQAQCTDRKIGTGQERTNACKRKDGCSSKSKSKKITDESSVIPPAPYLDFTFRRFFDEPDTQRRANSVQPIGNVEYTENFV